MIPRVILHTAVSADGRTDRFTPDVGLYYQLAGAFAEDATLAGSETILTAVEGAPDESLDPDRRPANDGGPAGDAAAGDGGAAPNGAGGNRPGNEASGAAGRGWPLLVVPDSRGRVTCWRRLLAEPYWRAGVSLCSRATDPAHLTYLERTGIDVIVAGDDHVDLRHALEELARRYDVRIVRVDSGGILNGALLRTGVASEVGLLVSPALVGADSPRSFYRAADLSGPEGVISLRLLEVQTLAGGHVWIRYEVGVATEAPQPV